jgi:hypothetical protein
MLLFVPLTLLFVVLGLLWVVAGGLLAVYYIAHTPSVLGKILEHKEEHCACFLGLKQHNAP